MKKKMINKVLTSMLVAAMLVPVSAFTALADEATGADASGTEVADSFKESMKAGGTITLTGDINIIAKDINIPSNVAVTLDLAGYTITGGNNSQDNINLSPYAELTVKDSSASKSGKIVSSTGSNNGLIDIDAGDFVLESGTIYSESNTAITVYDNYVEGSTIDNGGGTVTINGGSVESGYRAIQNSNGLGGHTLITVNGGSVIGGEYGIYSTYTGTPANHDVTINGGTVNSIVINSSIYALDNGIRPKLILGDSVAVGGDTGLSVTFGVHTTGLGDYTINQLFEVVSTTYEAGEVDGIYTLVKTQAAYVAERKAALVIERAKFTNTDYDNEGVEKLDTIVDKANEDMSKATTKDEVDTIFDEACEEMKTVEKAPVVTLPDEDSTTPNVENVYVYFDGGHLVNQVVEIEKGSTVAEYKFAEIDGYTFMGWYTEAGEKFDFSTVISSSVTLYAKFVVNDIQEEIDKAMDSVKDIDVTKELTEDDINTVTGAAYSLVGIINTSEQDVRSDDTIIANITKMEELLKVALKDTFKITASLPEVADDVVAEDKLPEKGVEVSGLLLATYMSYGFTNQELSMKVEQKASVDGSLVLHIQPQITSDEYTGAIPNTSLLSPVTFKLYLPEAFEGNVARITHVFSDASKGSEVLECPVLVDAQGAKYTNVTVNEFSEFQVTGINVETGVTTTPSTSTSTTTTSPKTGDSANVTFWFALAIMSVLSVCTVMKRRKA
ncbi:MAG: InlB B-repeat-containing protein [Eubacteriales bacterium]